MKKYQVLCIKDTCDQYEGREPHNDISDDFIGDYIEAESEEEAIDLAIDYIVEQSDVGDGDIEVNREAQEIIYRDSDGNITSALYCFTAKEYPHC